MRIFSAKNKHYPITYLYIMWLIYLIAAWCSVGYVYPDEHFQILEFAHYHIYHYPYSYPWELAAQIRPTLQAWIVIWLYKISNWSSWQMNPFTMSFITRAIAGFLSAIICYVFVNAFQHELQSKNKKKYLFLLSAFSYTAIFISVRFASENMSSLFFYARIFPIVLLRFT